MGCIAFLVKEVFDYTLPNIGVLLDTLIPSEEITIIGLTFSRMLTAAFQGMRQWRVYNNRENARLERIARGYRPYERQINKSDT